MYGLGSVQSDPVAPSRALPGVMSQASIGGGEYMGIGIGRPAGNRSRTTCMIGEHSNTDPCILVAP